MRSFARVSRTLRCVVHTTAINAAHTIAIAPTTAVRDQRGKERAFDTGAITVHDTQQATGQRDAQASVENC